MENEKRFLPIGTVVLLKGGKKELMIMSYCIIPSGDVYDKNGKVDVGDSVFDYGGCAYPEGMITSDQLFAFNHNQIDKICYRGYQTDKQKELSDALEKAMEARENIMKEAAQAVETARKEREEESQPEE